jgi:CheY-like chemotaxis protein
MESLPLSQKRYVGRYPGTVPPRYSVVRTEQPEPPPDKRFVLIVDDDPFFRSLFKVMLGQIGIHLADIQEAEDSATAFEICDTNPVDLVFCDYHLPRMRSKDGLEIIRELRQSHPDIPVFMITSENSEALVGEVCAVGATGHLLKPINLRTLKRILVSCRAPAVQP